ncbi:MAG: putative baseplate assembly protein, partial [Gemmatimonadetes bacterium]|nr:putative baseplate assembly protein [Gemmatimonadota bacterium]
MSATCRGGGRRARVRKAELNGLDFVEVSPDQRRLTVHFLGKAPPEVRRGNVAIRGGRRIRGIRVTEVEVVRDPDPALDDRLVVSIDRPGDFSTYTLAMVQADERGHPTERRMRGFDARYATVDFTFKAACPSPLDCAPPPAPPPAPEGPGPAHYLAKDYASFRQLMLDRLSLTLPRWTERHVPDVGIALVELMAFAGDELSYYQDAVATEAYLETARRRTSVRRHLRLVDYALHEGCNARAFVHVEVDAVEQTVARGELFFVTAWEGMPADGRVLSTDDLAAVPGEAYQVFEPVRAHGPTLRFHRAHNRIELYTWGERGCCLPRGATSATLRDAWLPADPPEQGHEPQQPQEPEQAPERAKTPRAVRGRKSAAPAAPVADTAFASAEEEDGPGAAPEGDAPGNVRAAPVLSHL